MKEDTTKQKAPSWDLSSRRALIDTTLSLPLILWKNRIQAGRSFQTTGVLQYSIIFGITNYAGYQTTSIKDTPPVVCGALAGLISVCGGLIARPRLTRSGRPSKTAMVLMASKEVTFWTGMNISNSASERRLYVKSAASQLLLGGVLANVLDVCLGRCISLGWSGQDLFQWICKSKREFGRDYIRSLPLRCLSSRPGFGVSR